jgi:hypothetical protein
MFGEVPHELKHLFLQAADPVSEPPPPGRKIRP